MGFSFTEWQSGSHNPLLRYVNSKFPVCSIFTTSTLQSGAATAHLPQLCCTIKSCPLHAKGKGMCAGREGQEAGKLLFFLLASTSSFPFSCLSKRQQVVSLVIGRPAFGAVGCLGRRQSMPLVSSGFQSRSISILAATSCARRHHPFGFSDLRPIHRYAMRALLCSKGIPDNSMRCVVLATGGKDGAQDPDHMHQTCMCCLMRCASSKACTLSRYRAPCVVLCPVHRRHGARVPHQVLQ